MGAAGLGSGGAARLGGGEREETLIVPPGGRWVSRLEIPEAVLEALGPQAGSNNWVLHGSRTASGKPLVAGDPHRTLEVPNVYYQNRVACPAFDAIGLSFPGVPGILHFGHNGTVAWCVTHAMADTQDLFVERFAPDGRYAFEGGWLEPVRRTEAIGVRGGATVRVEVVVTRHGPVVFGDPATGSAIALRWTGTDAPNRTLEAVLPMLQARTVEELDDAMRVWVDPCNNLVMADVHGTIGYLHRGRVPVRDASNRWGPVPGWTGRHEWRGDVPFEELPRLRNPETGFIVTANNRVWGDGPHYLGTDYAPPYRARRILERLEGLEGARAEDMASIHADCVSLAARKTVESLAKLRLPPGPRAELRDLLAGWDGSMDPGGLAPLVYAALRDQLAAVLLEREPLARLGEDPFPEDPDPTPAHTRVRAALPRLLEVPDAFVLGGASWEAVVGEALDRAVALLERALGPDRARWRWGSVHLTAVSHPLSALFPEAVPVLDPPSVACGGDGETVRVAVADVGLGVEHASVARYVFDLGDPDRSGWVIPLGASGHPGSPHYADQAPLWADVRLVPMTYTWARVEAGAAARQELWPA